MRTEKIKGKIIKFNNFYITWKELNMQMIRRFFPLPSLPACSTAKLTDARKFGFETTSGVSDVFTKIKNKNMLYLTLF